MCIEISSVFWIAIGWSVFSILRAFTTNEGTYQSVKDLLVLWVFVIALVVKAYIV